MWTDLETDANGRICQHSHSKTVCDGLVCLPNTGSFNIQCSTSNVYNNTSSTLDPCILSILTQAIYSMLGSLFCSLLLASITYSASLTGVRNPWLDPYSLRSNPLYPYARSLPFRPSSNTPIYYGSRFRKDSGVSPSRTRPSRLGRRQDISETVPEELDTRPTPQPTGEPSDLTTVFINNENEFALLLPVRPGGTFVPCFNVRAPPE